MIAAPSASSSGWTAFASSIASLCEIFSQVWRLWYHHAEREQPYPCQDATMTRRRDARGRENVPFTPLQRSTAALRPAPKHSESRES
jgi:hypothetical protein